MTADEAIAEIHRMNETAARQLREAQERAVPTPTADDFLLGVLKINGPDAALDYVREIGRSAFSPLVLEEVFQAQM